MPEFIAILINQQIFFIFTTLSLAALIDILAAKHTPCCRIRKFWQGNYLRQLELGHEVTTQAEQQSLGIRTT
jgi:hypothetical protein